MRSYKQYCGVAKALDVVGQRWALLLVRELILGPRRFTDLLLPGLTPTVLSARLKHLKEEGIVTQVELPPPAARQAWALTETGRALQPVVFALGAFGARYLGDPSDGDERRVRWLMVSLHRRYQGGVKATVNVDLPGEAYRITATPSDVQARDGLSDAADATVSGPPMAIVTLFARGVVHPQLQIIGDRAVVAALGAALGPP